MHFLSSRARTAAKTLTQKDYLDQVQVKPDYGTYRTSLGSGAASATALTSFEDQLRRRDAEGYWKYGAAIDRVSRIPPGTPLRSRNETDTRRLWDQLLAPFALDVITSRARQSYVDELHGRALRGELHGQLDANLEPEQNYFIASTGAPTPGAAPAWPAMSVRQKVTAWPPGKPSAYVAPRAHVASRAPGFDDALVRRKAKAWLTHTNSPPEAHQILDAHARSDGAWPLGDDASTLITIWKKLVPSAPPYRSASMGTPYPSSVAGMVLLQRIMARMATEALPARGDAGWEDWALYLYGAAMAVQAFPDGNKRVCRAAYAIVIASAGVDFRAPNGKFGGELANML